MNKGIISLALVVVLACGLVAWLNPRPVGDLYLALGGGRDVVDGKLGQPDDWSFITDGAVWINQSWGSGVIFFCVQRLGGDTGLLVLKALLLLGIVFGIVRATMARSGYLGAALLAAGCALAVSPMGMMLRPNLVSLALIPVLMLFLHRSENNPRWLWASVGLLSLWANLHGAFLVGLGILGLWSTSQLVVWATRRRDGFPWEPLLATTLAVVAAAFLNPFGYRNLTLSLSVARDPAWKNLTEWKPVPLEGPDVPWVFLGMAALVVVTGLASVGIGRLRERCSPAMWIFDGLIVTAVLVLAFRAERFLPLAGVMLAPILAGNLSRILPRDRVWSLGVLTVVGTLIVVYGVLPHRWITTFYDADNPRRPNETLYQRMILAGTDIPEGAADFLVANNVSGRAFHPWEWEGYLHWRCPDLDLFVGGRAHQVYRSEDFFARRGLLQDPDPALRFRELGIHVVVMPLSREYGPLAQRLLLESGNSWTYVYSDRRFAVMVDIGDPETRALAQQASRGTLTYPDEGIALLSQGMCMATPAVETPDEWVVEALETSNRLYPASYSYPVLDSRATSAGVSEQERAAYLEQEYERLLTLPTEAADGLEFLRSREVVARLLSRIHPDLDRRRELIQERHALRAQIRAIEKPY